MKDIDKYYDQIRDANEQIKLIREKCPHKQVYTGLYSDRPGNISNAKLCKECDALIENIGCFGLNTNYGSI